MFRILIAALALSGCASMPSGEPLRIGMTSVEVVGARGQPDRVNRTRTADGPPTEQWVYENYLGRMSGSTYTFVYFENYKVVAIQD
jgi:hypothetical protein